MNRKRNRHVSLVSAVLAAGIMTLLLAPWPVLAEAPADGIALDINRAGVSELASLPGIGEAKAEAIVAHRNASGPFQRVEDLLSVRGIGEKVLGRIRNLVSVNAP